MERCRVVQMAVPRNKASSIRGHTAKRKEEKIFDLLVKVFLRMKAKSLINAKNANYIYTNVI